MRELKRGQDNKLKSSGTDGRKETKKTKKNKGNCRSTNEKAGAEANMEEVGENGKKRKTSDKNRSNDNKRRKYEPETPRGVNTSQTRFSAEQQVKLQLSRDRTKRTEIRHTEITKQQKVKVLLEAGKVVMHNINNVDIPTEAATSSEEENKDNKVNKDNSDEESDSEYEDESY